MAADKKQKLEMTVAALQKKWGTRAIRRLRTKEQRIVIPHIPTGFPALDDALEIGGLPRGRISEIVGIPTSGMATIALRTIANAQKEASHAIYIDPAQTFDPEYAARCGLALERLLLVRPYNMHQSMAILQDFIKNLGPDSDGIPILIFDTPINLLTDSKQLQHLATTLDRIAVPLSQSICALLFLVSLPNQSNSTMKSYPPGSTLPHHAAVRLFVKRERWLYKQFDIHGYQAQVVIAKNKFGPGGRQVSIAITLGKPDECSTGDADERSTGVANERSTSEDGGF